VVFQLGKTSEERGEDATGISYINNNEMYISKMNIKASIFFKQTINNIDKIKIITGHTRFATQGDPAQNYNNHPFFGKTKNGNMFSLCHNGHIYNNSKLTFKRNKIKTDSYVAVQLLETQKKIDFESIRFLSENIEGRFVFTILDDKNNLYIAKGNNPFFGIDFTELGIFVYASTKDIFYTAVSKTFLKGHLKDKKNIEIELIEGDILKIDKFGNMSTDYFDPTKYLDFCAYSDYDDYDDIYNNYNDIYNNYNYYNLVKSKIKGR